MKAWPRVFRDALISGSAASLASMAVLALRGRKDVGDALQPLNAPSHWLHGERGTRQRGASLRYTLPGLLTHHASALFWALFYERLVPDRSEHRSAPALLGHAALASAVAAFVDLKLVPKRLTPGFERPLRPNSLGWVYAGFALGLAAGSFWAGRRETRIVERRLSCPPAPRQWPDIPGVPGTPTPALHEHPAAPPHATQVSP